MPPSSSEEDLISQCRAGHAGAWDQVFSRHYSSLSHFVCTVLPGATTQDIEEVCQETFIAAIRHIGTFAGRSHFQTWLFRIASNKARDFRDYQRALKRGGGVPPLSLDAGEDRDGPPPPEPATPSPSPDQSLLRQETHDEVQQALDDLGDSCRQIIELRYFGELDYDAIGQTLSLHPKTVSSRLSRCLDKLGVLLAETRLVTPPRPLPR